MNKQRCDYCGREVDVDAMSALENGSPACIECVTEEERKKEEKTDPKIDICKDFKDTETDKAKTLTWFDKIANVLPKREMFHIGIVIVTIVVCLFVGMMNLSPESTKESESTSTSVEEQIESNASFVARMHYRSNYDTINLEITVASVRNINGNWKASGKVFATDEYGDTYSANWSITYNQDLKQIKSEYGEPTKDELHQFVRTAQKSPLW